MPVAETMLPICGSVARCTCQTMARTLQSHPKSWVERTPPCRAWRMEAAWSRSYLRPWLGSHSSVEFKPRVAVTPSSNSWVQNSKSQGALLKKRHVDIQWSNTKDGEVCEPAEASKIWGFTYFHLHPYLGPISGNTTVWASDKQVKLCETLTLETQALDHFGTLAKMDWIR